MNSRHNDEVLRFLEPASPGDLRPAARRPTGLTVAEQQDEHVVPDTACAIGAPYGWPSLSCHDVQWSDYLRRT